MHLCNAWLPPPVAEEAKREKESFARVVATVKELWRPDDPESLYSTLKWLSVIQLFVKAKSDVSMEDVSSLIEFGLDVFHQSHDKLHAQVKWGTTLISFLNKHRDKLSLKVQWRPLYDCLMNTHFRRSIGPEGWKVRQQHFTTVSSLVRHCRRFFPHGSAMEIWLEFRPLLENPWHNLSFEGAGLLRLFLPTNLENQDFFVIDWIENSLRFWDDIPNCNFWICQWASIIARIIKHLPLIDWESKLSPLFTKYLNMFAVPVANGSGSATSTMDVPRITKYLFPTAKSTPARTVAKSIVYLLKPGSSAQTHFEKLVNLLEQYYHPSNGGHWTSSLERFLHYLVLMFEKRLKEEQCLEDSRRGRPCLGIEERTRFVRAVLKLIDRGQYSKTERLSKTVASAISILSYVEPSLVLPFVASRFHMALETMTATHQLKAAVMSVAYTGRSFLLSSSSNFPYLDNHDGANFYSNLLAVSLSNALLGIDVNDPPKTVATMQLVGSVISNMPVLDDDCSKSLLTSGICLSEWLDEFFCRLFSLLLHLEPNRSVGDGSHLPVTSGTFLVEDGSYYFCVLQIMLTRLSKSLRDQAMKRISKFVKTNILAGATAEVGLLCCACVVADPDAAVAQLIRPLIFSILSSLEATCSTGFGGRDVSESSGKAKLSLSPALETTLEYQLKVLSVAISYGGVTLLSCRDHLKEVISSAFDSTSWKVNGAGSHVLRSLLGSLIHYFPIDQYTCVSYLPGTVSLEEWICTKNCASDRLLNDAKWHIPSVDEVEFANELIKLHLNVALDDLWRICQTKIHSNPGNEKDHLKVTLLRINSSLEGVMSCLPDLRPSSTKVDGNLDSHDFIIAGSSGANVGSTELREKSAEVIHVACKYLLENKSDDSILLTLLIQITDSLGNYGSLEYNEWSYYRQAWKLESAAVVEPPINFILNSHSKGKKRPRWAIIDKTYIHNAWRSSQVAFHRYKTNSNACPPGHTVVLVDDLLDLCLHGYEIVRMSAGKSLLKMIKRWPALISKCALMLTENLKNPNASEHEVLGSCAILASKTILKHLTMDAKAFSSFLIAILASSHHDSMKAQKAISELFIKYNVHFAGVSRSILRLSNNQLDVPDFLDLVSKISSMSFGSNVSHWRYNLMANRILLLLAMVARNDLDVTSEILNTISGHFLKNLRSQLPQMRILSISALNVLLKESPYRVPIKEKSFFSGESRGSLLSPLEASLTTIIQDEGFLTETLDCLSHLHVIKNIEGSSSGESQGSFPFQSIADKTITKFYFDFSSSWPRTPSWISLLSGENFYPSFARIFKRLVQECGSSFFTSLKNALEEFINSKERPKQCVAAEVLAGVLHSDVISLLGELDSWITVQLQGIILGPSVESLPEWAACIRYAVTGKGRHGARIPLARQRILECLAAPLPHTATNTVVSRRYTLLSYALLEVSPCRMSTDEVKLHMKLVNELLANMKHSSAQVRESIGVALCILCSNLRLYSSFPDNLEYLESMPDIDSWYPLLVEQSKELVSALKNNIDDGHCIDVWPGDSEDDIKWMETMFHFASAALKSSRSSCMGDAIVELFVPLMILQGHPNRDLSSLANSTLKFLKGRIFAKPYLSQAVSSILGLTSDTHWRVKSMTLKYLETFMYRHTFILSTVEKEQIWDVVERLLVDSQVEVREDAAAVLSGLLKGGNEDLADAFRDRAYHDARDIFQKRMKRNLASAPSVPSVHGAVLALSASVLSAPYDVPSWLPEQVTLLACFIMEPPPVKSTVTKAVAEFKRTHADTWNFQKELFTEEQLEVLADTCSSSSYFA